jgi:RNA polymerase sigma factor (TIGR02999 family)
LTPPGTGDDGKSAYWVCEERPGSGSSRVAADTILGFPKARRLDPEKYPVTHGSDRIDPRGTITALLEDWQRGEAAALERLMPLVYSEMRRIARAHLGRERPAHTLEPTALVHEVFLRLVDQDRVDWQGRVHFYSLASRIMRRVLVDHARRQQAVKRSPVEPPAARVLRQRADEVLAVEVALERLAALDPRLVQVVEMRFYGGMNVHETAAALDVSPATVKRDWRTARAWLHRELTAGGGADGGP